MNILETIKKNTMLIALILISLFFAFKTNGALLSPSNITNLILQNSYVVILAIGMLLCILTGGNIDLSVGSVVALVGAIAGKLIVENGMNIWIAIAICLIVGLLIGIWQGFWIAYIRIPPFIVTLAGMLLWRGVALIILDGLTISPFPASYTNLFNSFIGSKKFALIFGCIISLIYVTISIILRIKKSKKGYNLNNIYTEIIKMIAVSAALIFVSYKLSQNKGLPIILIILAVFVLAYTYYTSKTVWGRHFYAVGGNEKAAKLSGINTNRVLFTAYANMSVLSAVAALICVARFNSAAPTAGQNYEMDAIASCFIGGASAYGGIGTIPGVVIGAIFMGVLNNGMSIMGIDSNYQRAVKGLVLLAAVVFDVLSKKKSR